LDYYYSSPGFYETYVDDLVVIGFWFLNDMFRVHQTKAQVYFIKQKWLVCNEVQQTEHF